MKELLRGLDHKTISESGFHRINPDYKIIEDISSELQGTVFGQEKAMDSLARAVTRSMAGFSDPRRPEMTAMFLGPTGVGKTEAGKALAKYLYPRSWEDRFLRIDCTQLMEGHSVGRLKGTEPGYVGYGDNNILITPEFLDRGGVIVFDEIEKAHPNIIRWLLPVLEEGQQKALTPVQGQRGWSSELSTLNFSKSYIIMTANVGAEALHKARAGEQGMGFHASNQKPDMEKIGTAELRKHFKDMPEFLGRIDSTVVFQDLERPQYEKIFNKFMDKINEDQRYGHNFLAVTTELRNFILDHAETGEYGAREIRHKINSYLLDKASEIKFSGILPEMSPLIGDLENNEVIFWTSKIEEKKPELKLLEDKFIEERYVEPEEEIDEDLPIKSQRDEGSYIGRSPKKKDVEDTGDEDIKGPKDLKFYVPLKPGASFDLAITIHQPGKGDLQQAIEGMPLL
ncbi:AAA family ATPase [Candidatus Dojkabacteria bacterium]|jgi:ATP-dependent Clp protease ATP-binding subunit ClpA|nr:AAA family ATPase [Candidatus Dojkabacteria bacterium]